MQGASGAFLSTDFWTNCIDRVSSHAHDSRIGRALTTCVMALKWIRTEDVVWNVLSKADPCAARDTLSCRAGHEWTHLAVCAWVHHNIVPSVLVGGRGCSPRTANVPPPLRPAKLRSGRGMLCSSGHVVHMERARWPVLVGGARAGVRDRRCPRQVLRARPGGSCKAIHGTEFGVGNACRVVRSEWDIFAVWDHLAGNGMWRFPAITAGPRRGSGPIRAPDSGDDTTFRGGPPPRATGPI